MINKKENWKGSLTRMYEAAVQLMKKSANATVDSQFRERELRQLLKILGWKDPNGQIVRVDIKADVFYKNPKQEKPIQQTETPKKSTGRPEDII